jgi:hypothetical protein
MGARKKTAPVVRAEDAATRRSRGRIRGGGVSLPVPPPRAEMPRGYAETLGDLKQRIQQERLRVVLAASSAMVLLYWDIGQVILERQQREGWGRRSSIGCRQICARPTPRCGGSLREISSTCAALRRPGPTGQLCKSRLHNYPGITR